MDSWIILVLFGIFGILPIIYSALFFILSLRQLGELQKDLQKLLYEKSALDEVIRDIHEAIEEIQTRIKFFSYQAQREADLFKIMNSLISEMIDKNRPSGGPRDSNDE